MNVNDALKELRYVHNQLLETMYKKPEEEEPTRR